MNPLSFYRALVVLNGSVPLLMLGWDGWHGQLGANSVNHALHITGILSLVSLFLSLLMTPLRWITGWGGWIAFRRALGLYGFFYAVLHLGIYVVFDRALSLSSTFNEVGMRMFLQVGALSLVLMIPLAVTSTNAMIRWLGSKRWKGLHRLTYLVAILGVLHYYMLVKSDVRQPLAFAGVLALLLGGRVGKRVYDSRKSSGNARLTAVRQTSLATSAPIKARQQWKGEMRVAAIFQETHNVKTFRLVAQDVGPLPFDYQPGQFVNVQLTIDGKRVNRSYTLASSPSNKAAYELTTKREPLGLASRYMHDQLQAGDVLKISGPAGRFVFTGNGESSVLLIAGGVGITPVMSICRYLTDTAWPGNIYFLIVAKTEADLIFREEIRSLEQRFPKLRVCVTLSRTKDEDTWMGERGRVSADLLQRFVPGIETIPAYLCGPNEMMDATRALLREIGVPDSQVYTEAFSGKKSAKEPMDDSLLLQDNSSDQMMTGMMPAIMMTSASIRFARSAVETEISKETSILEAAERAGIDLPFECRSGICGQCKVMLKAGQVYMDCEDALSVSEKATGCVLACQAKPVSNVVVDA